MKRLLKGLCQIQCAEVPRAVFCLEMRTFLTHYTWGANVPQSLHLPRQKNYFRHRSQRSLEQMKETTFDDRLASVRAPVVRCLYCPSAQNLIKSFA